VTDEDIDEIEKIAKDLMRDIQSLIDARLQDLEPEDRDFVRDIMADTGIL
jgi:hypothetical protein